ncbi:MAG TPA: monovalent cation/H(+) antiporter subunit G [Firmicutes bacterium]|jgi:multicomponent Na+:H+ antiporter subunit G|nr:monovalent cation/H(+) antiporter subunit G [Bacillota bacterium]
MIKHLAAMILMGSGFFFLAVSAIGLIRMPDVYNRMHALGKCDTLGNWLLILGLILVIGDLTSAAKMALIIILVALINPVMTHLLAKTSYGLGMDLVEGSYLLDDYTSPKVNEERGEQKG